MAEERRAWVQRERDKPAGTVAWSEHCEAWLGYERTYPGSARDQDAERINQRGGFGYYEMTDYMGHEPTTWAPRS